MSLLVVDRLAELHEVFEVLRVLFDLRSDFAGELSFESVEVFDF
jgi:hypothetical protein